MNSPKKEAATLDQTATLKNVSSASLYRVESIRSSVFCCCPTRAFLRREMAAILAYLNTVRLPKAERKRLWYAFGSTLRKIQVLDA